MEEKDDGRVKDGRERETGREREMRERDERGREMRERQREGERDREKEREEETVHVLLFHKPQPLVHLEQCELMPLPLPPPPREGAQWKCKKSPFGPYQCFSRPMLVGLSCLLCCWWAMRMSLPPSLLLAVGMLNPGRMCRLY